jgi:HPt (histidine-containing phosphotransfer) domain-containing protein
MINWQRISELEADIGEDEVDEVLSLFLEEMDEVVEIFASASATIDLPAQLHLLKGMAWNVGFVDVGDVCVLAEQSVSDEKRFGIVGTINAIYAKERQELTAKRDICA